jgi:glycosyltransferase involved in cell wall biosynthesis
MNRPALSVVVPTLNEEQWIEEFLGRVSRFLESRRLSWEIVVADDGSSDATPARVERWAASDSRVRVLRQPHRGKGAAVREGLLAATGAWRLMTDADLSVSPDDWNVLLAAAAEPTSADLIVGSREAIGARRIGEPVARHIIGRAFNWTVQLLAVPGINDTQCGFKLLRGEAAQALVPHLTLNGFAFDVELLFLAQRAGFTIREVGVVWICRPDSRVRLASGAAAFADVVRIRLRHLGGRYSHVVRGRSAPGSQSHGVSI